jgi:hypothetical protein
MATLLSSSSLKSGGSFGNASASSLVKSASTLANEIATYNDTVQRLTFENSAKTSSDLQAYSDYLKGRLNSLQSTGTIVDATKAMDMQQTLISATHSSASADIQRSTIAILDGQGTSDDKLQALGTAYQRLYAMGDTAAAQSYEEQYYSFSQTVQLQKQQAASALASASSAASSKYLSVVDSAVTGIKNNVANANAAFAAQGPKFLDQQTNSYLKQQTAATGAKTNGAASIFAALAGQVGMVNPKIQLNNTTKYEQGTYTPGSILDIYTQAMVADPNNASKYQANIDKYLNGSTGISLPGEGSKSITYNALMNTVYAGNSGNAPYGVVQGADGSFNVAAEHVSGYTFGQDQNGNTKLMASYSFFNAPIPTGTAQTLSKAGINVKEDSGGDYWFQATTNSTFLGKVLGNNPVQGTVQKDGSVEFMGSGGQLYHMVKGSNVLFGVQQLNAFGQVVNANVAGQYGFQPPKSQLVVGKGSTDFMTKVLGNSATPQEVDGKIIYQANGKAYQLVSDSKGLKGLQEVDNKGNVVNKNVAGQYGFNPDGVNGRVPANGPKGASFSFGNFETNMSNWFGPLADKFMGHASADAYNPNSIHAFSGALFGVNTMINNAQIMQSINQAHNQAMIALAPPPLLPSISLPVPSAPKPTPIVSAPVKLQSAPTAPSIQAANGNPQGNNFGNIQSGGSGIQIKGTVNGNPGAIKL